MKTHTLLSSLLEHTGTSPAELARVTHVSPAEVSNIRAGRRHGDRGWISAADTALRAGGELRRAWERDEAARKLQQVIAATESAAGQLLAAPDAGTPAGIHERIADLGVQYLHLRCPGEPFLATAAGLQRELARRLKQHAYTERDLPELRAAAGRVCGIIAYATLDLGSPAAAQRNAAACFRMGELAGHSELQAWARGTQSLIARYEKDYRRAETLIYDGMSYAGKRSGTAGIRLLAGGAQCRANQGDRDGAIALLDSAAAQRDQYRPRDEVSGLFAFSEAKGRYYGGSALMWLPGRDALRRASRDSAAAIAMWDDGPDATRSVADQHLARVYQATALARLGDLDGATEAVRPVLGLPPEMRISWLQRRMSELATHLTGGRYAGSAAAAAAAGEISGWAGDDT